MTVVTLAFLHLLLLTAEKARSWILPVAPVVRRQHEYFSGHHHLILSRPQRSSPISATSTAEASGDIKAILDDVRASSLPLLRIGSRVGSGSYGTVHQGYLISAEDDFQPCIAKRAWTLAEIEANVPSRIFQLDQEEKQRREQLAVAQRTGLASVKLAQNDGEVTNAESEPLSASDLKTRSDRCRHYWDVERHCYQKMEEINRQKNHMGNAAPKFLGVHRDDGRGDQFGSGVSIQGYGRPSNEKGNKCGQEWMVLEFVGTSLGDGSIGKPAQTLLDAMELAWKSQHLQSGKGSHCLYDIQKAMNLPESYTFGDTLDAIFLSLLENLKEIHDYNIVHRDLKPGNLLCANERLRLFDFGSAADLDPSPAPPGIGSLFSGGTRRVGYDEGFAAISPVYCAPEIFVKVNENPLSFDVFSAGLIMSQLMFNLLDERTDAGFLQQLKAELYDLDSWLEKELGAKLRPAGLENGLEHLAERRGLWTLMKLMLAKDPVKRISSSQALERLKQIAGLRIGEIEWSDSLVAEVAREEAYLETVVESLESCPLNLGLENMPRPLHFLASFKKGSPVGLMLAEASEVVDDGTMSSGEWERWQRATQSAFPGEVFVKGWDASSQAGLLGIFEIGDRLRGVGELPFVDGGFEQAIKLINRQPKGGTLKLHFDRIPTPKVPAKSDPTQVDSRRAKVVGQGAWKSGGRRGNQEDAFVLHEIKNEKKGENVLLAGVFDGHAGTAASETVSCILPSLFTTELLAAPEATIKDALENSWATTCDTYRNGCDENGECSARYDAVEGILYAETGSKDLFAGTTATIAALSMDPSGADELTILNCGDSRTLVIGQPLSPEQGDSVVVFETRDHSPDDEIEIERLERGKAAGLDYSIPQCSTIDSFMVVGDYQYALCRSLEGSFVTSKGIVSEPDVTTLNLASSLADREHCALVLACDGLFEVMCNEEVGREVVRMRREGYMAGDIAKNLCGQALKKGSYDNLSVVVIYLDLV